MVCKWVVGVVFWSSVLSIRFERNGYEDLVIGISPEVKENHELVDALKELVINASRLLYIATRQRSYFREVKILIPSSWSHIGTDDGYVYEDSHIRIASRERSHDPFTLQTKGCGEPADYIILTPEFLLKHKGSHVDIAKRFVHEWARLRYGVFEEMGVSWDTRYPLYYIRNYYTSRGLEARPTWNVCSPKDISGHSRNKITGKECDIDPSKGIPDENCEFYPDPNLRINASLMAFTNVESVHLFCDNTFENGHVIEAPTRHNVMCGGKSTWDVITQHVDFANGHNLAREVSSTVPVFSIVQTTKLRIVLVVDISGSMVEQDKIGRLRSSLVWWIKNEVPDGAELGIVTFSDYTEVLATLSPINPDTRSQLYKLLPKEAVHSAVTCIGCAVQVAQKMLRRGGVMVLVTDGVENKWPYISEVTQASVESKCRVFSITFTDEPHSSIDALSEATGGRSFYVKNAADIFKALWSIGKYMWRQPQSVLVVSEFTNSGQHNEEFYVDEDTKDNLVIQMVYSRKEYISDAYALSPFWKGGNMYLLQRDPSNNLATIHPDIAETGSWTFRAELDQKSKDDYALIIVKQVSNKLTYRTSASCWLSTKRVDPTKDKLVIFAQVTRGEEPVIGCEVWARVMPPDGDVINLHLLDNGAGADVTQHDGIYSRFFTKFSKKGIYHVDCSVRKNKPAFYDRFSAKSSTSQHSNLEKDMHFIRFESAGNFQCTKEVDESEDIFPPSRVTDLSVNIVMSPRESNFTNYTLKIEWTATGGDLDDGQAYRYTLKMSTDFIRLQKHFEAHPNLTLISDDHILEGSLEPLRSGEQQVIVLDGDVLELKPYTIYFFGLKSFDERGHDSGISNVASVVIIPDAFKTLVQGHDPSKNSTHPWGLVTGLVIGFTLLMTFTAAGVIYYRRKKRRRPKPYWRR